MLTRMADNPTPSPGHIDFDPNCLQIPDGLTFGVTPGAWRLALSPNRQFVFLLTRDQGHIGSVVLDAEGARKLAGALLEVADLATGANTPASALLIPVLDEDKVRRDLKLPGAG